MLKFSNYFLKFVSPRKIYLQKKCLGLWDGEKVRGDPYFAVPDKYPRLLHKISVTEKVYVRRDGPRPFHRVEDIPSYPTTLVREDRIRQIYLPRLERGESIWMWFCPLSRASQMNRQEFLHVF